MPRPEISDIVFGTMRMTSKSWAVDRWCDFFNGLQQIGIRRLHVSAEYDSFPLVCAVLAQRRRDGMDDFSVTVKLAEPSFGDMHFGVSRFFSKIEFYMQQLGAPQLETVQWMSRASLTDDATRIEAFLSQIGQLEVAVAEKKTSGEIGKFFCFPYTPSFAMATLNCSFVDGLALYRNVDEREFDTVCEVARERGREVLAIRPFGAGKLFDQGHDAISLLDHVFACTSVRSVVVTATELSHLSSLRAYFNA